MRTSRNRREYWMTMDAKDLASRLLGVDQSYRGRNGNPLFDMWVRNSYAYYSTVFDAQSWTTALSFTGEQGELVKMSLPQARSLVRDAVTLVTKQKLAFQALGKIDDTEVTEEMRIANALASQIVEEQSLDVQNELMVEHGFVLGTGFLKAVWRSDKGRPRAVEVLSVDEASGEERRQVVYDGDLEITVPLIFDLLYDFTVQRWEDLFWVKERVKRNRWDLVEQHPELEEEILRLPACSDEDRAKTWFGLDDLDDMVYVHELYHKPSPALPRGRMMIFASDRCVFFDDENPYGTIPIEQFKPEPLMGLGAGYPLLSSLLPAQEMYDHEYSAIATNHAAFAVQNIAVPRGADISTQQLLGMNFVDYTPQPIEGGGRPVPLELAKTSGEVFKFSEMLLQNMQGMARINAAVRGDLPAGTSGVAIATQTTNALEFFSGYAKSNQTVLKKVMMHAVNAYRRFATVERQVTIVGKNNQRFLKAYTGDILEPITGFEMQLVNPMMQTMAGRLDIAEKMVSSGLVKDVQGYVAVLDGQPLSRLYESELSEEDLIASENEMMAEGRKVQALSIDDHAKHIMKHKVQLNDPRIRESGEATALFMEHILEHLRLQTETDPLLMAMANTGRIPEMPPGGMGGVNPPPDSPPEGGGGPEGSTGDLAGKDLPLPEAEPAAPAQDLLGRTA